MDVPAAGRQECPSWTSSLLLGCREGLVTVAAMHDEFILAGVLDEASIDELTHHFGCESTSLGVFCQLHHLLLEGTDLCVLSLLLSLFLCSSLLVSLDLRLSAAPLRADLQHVS